MKFKDILTKEYLQTEYCENSKTANEIANNIGCNVGYVRQKLADFRILKPKKTKEEIYSKYIGNTYNRWTIDSWHHYKNVAYVNCICKCKTKKVCSLFSVVRGYSKSCGCYASDKNRTGYKDISGQYWRRIKGDGAKRNKEFCITIEYAWNLFLEQNKKCALTGVDIAFVSDGNELAKQTASLDRIDNTKGYIEGNIQWVHKRVNWIKSTLSTDELLYWCNKIHEHNIDYHNTKEYGIVTNYHQTT